MSALDSLAMADESPRAEPATAPPAPAPEVPVVPTGPTEAEIVALQGFRAPPESVTTSDATSLDGSEELKSKVTVRTRYPIGSFTAGDGTVIDAAGSDVQGSKLGALVTEARTSGVTLERI